MPSVGAERRTTDGIFLDVALLSELRTRTIQTSASADTVWGTDVEVTPGIGFEYRTSTFNLSLGYAPRLTMPFNVGDFELAVLNRATLLASWQAHPHWTISAVGLFVVGDYSQLLPASTPGGAGPPPPVLNPVRSFQTYPYVGIDTLLRVDWTVSPRSRIRVAGGYFDVGGVGTVGQANQPRAWGPQAEGDFAWDLSRTATLTTTAKVQDWILQTGIGLFPILVTTVTEGWKQAWTGELETSLAAGAGFSNRNVESATAAGHLVPVASFRLDYTQRVHQPLHFQLNAGLAPYVDVYQDIPYQRFTYGGSVDWSPSDAWQLGVAISGALAPYTVRAPESYGTAGLSASFAPVPFLVLSAGGYGQLQFQGATDGGGTFRQWTAYFSVALRDRFSF
jgi:hypothetical protein